MVNPAEMMAAIANRLESEFPWFPVGIQESSEDPGTWHISVFDVDPNLVGSVEDFILALQDDIDPKLEKLFIPLVADHAATEKYYPEHLRQSNVLQLGVASKWIAQFTQWQQADSGMALPFGPLAKCSAGSDPAISTTIRYSEVKSLGLADWLFDCQITGKVSGPGWKTGEPAPPAAGQSEHALAA